MVDCWKSWSGATSPSWEKRLFFSADRHERAPKNGDEEESRRVGHFLAAAPEKYVGFATCGGNKTFRSFGGRSPAQKVTACGNNQCGTNFSWCRERNVFCTYVRMHLTCSSLRASAAKRYSLNFISDFLFLNYFEKTEIRDVFSRSRKYYIPLLYRKIHVHTYTIRVYIYTKKFDILRNVFQSVIALCDIRNFVLKVKKVECSTILGSNY